MIDERKMFKQPPSAPTARPLPYSELTGDGRLPSTIEPPDRPRHINIAVFYAKTVDTDQNPCSAAFVCGCVKSVMLIYAQWALSTNGLPRDIINSLIMNDLKKDI